MCPAARSAKSVSISDNTSACGTEMRRTSFRLTVVITMHPGTVSPSSFDSEGSPEFNSVVGLYNSHVFLCGGVLAFRTRLGFVMPNHRPADARNASSRGAMPSRLPVQRNERGVALCLSDKARRARCSWRSRAPNDRRSPEVAPCRSKALRASRWHIRSSDPRRWRRQGRPPGTARNRCI